MKNHIAFKFLAVLLCALTLLGSIVCILGIAVMEQEDLYNTDVPALQEDYKQRLLSGTARSVVAQYAAATLSGCPDRLLEEYYGTYSFITDLVDGAWFYTLIGPDGKELESTAPTGRDDLIPYKFSDIGTWYIELVEGPWESGSDYNDNGSHAPMLTPTEPLTDSTMPATMPDSGGVYGIIYWDYDAGCYMEASIRDVRIEGYTVIIHANDASFVERSDWQLLTFAWENRYNLITALVVCLLLFAVGAVYLCCAAGKRPGSDEIKPGGFNALPLDLYAVLVLLLTFLTWQVVEEIRVWYDYSNFVFFWFLLFAGFFVCLIFVGFCFACAAQFKEGNGRWWRKSAIGFTVIALWDAAKDLLGLLVRGCRWLRSHVPSALGKFFGGLIRLVVGAWSGMRKIAAVLWDLLKRACLWLWTHLSRLAVWAWRKFKQAARWLGHKANRVLSLLPLTWQWLLVGFALVCMLYICLRSYRTGWILVGFGIFFSFILYGSNAFGILMEAAKRMGKGDLDTKVPDRFLIGSFKEFSNDLNALADVAKVAAQKEMKSERMKTELITNVTHDIKTPLTSIINYVDLLQKPHTPEEEQQYLEVLGRKSEQLKKLIQDLMEMSKASTGNMAVDIRQVDAVEAVNQALGEFSDKLAASNLTPVFTPAEESVTMLADGRLVWRVLNNLLSNAVKYAMPGTRLYIDLVRRGGNVCISLKNISAQPLNVDADELMERFVRGDASRNTDGSGLGLNIAKSLMEVQHGSLELTIDGDLFKATMHFPAQ